MNASENSETLLVFPCDFPVKIMGLMQDDFAQSMIDIVLRHAPDFAVESVEMRASSAGKYISLTCTIRATSKPQLDNLYRELSAHPWVKVAL
jgi:putative lipoic acid-binding regulatory protein